MMYVGSWEKERCMEETERREDVCRKLGEGKMYGGNRKYVGGWEKERCM